MTEAKRDVRPENVRAVRLGHGANCSSVGSVVDTLFVSAALGGALFAALCAAMKDEDVKVTGSSPNADADAGGDAGESDTEPRR
ncbi:hypothetical protein AKJ09_07840 [Labilithrix luteola]|uniref:Uncharacterized protein n=1 Tax=Labilithrix luteola TaxID=1391654 RepID=A0A0K1Q682_9BACT|nr:hypothetical protein [Labilithrix luteola]AKV01177.1 hypothetical protein AKJ09_07840 [Labilithrix luteola]